MSLGPPEMSSFAQQIIDHARALSDASRPDPSDGKKLISPSYDSKKKIKKLYEVVGFISSGTYGRVYKAKSKLNGSVYAIKQWVDR